MRGKWSSASLKYVMPRIPVLGALLVAVGTITGSGMNAEGETSTMFCVPPLLPVVPENTALQIEFRDILSAEFSNYFDESGRYLTCLNNAATATRSETKMAIETYTRLLNLPRQ